jgi:D-alanyl-D-alanine carboxypeptidase
MLGYAEVLLRTWNGADSAVLTSAQLRAMVDPEHLPEAAADAQYGYALNWETDDNSNEIVFLGHGGDMVGYEADLVVDLANGICVAMLANGAVSDYKMTGDIQKLVAASITGEPLPELSTETLRSYESADAWTGQWHSRERSIEIVIAEDGLRLLSAEDRIPLQRYSRRSNYYLTADHPAWERYLFKAERAETGDESLGPITAILHGPERYLRAGDPLPDIPAYPAEWEGFVGLYRSYNPWYPVFRVVLRDGTLVLIDSFGDSSPLVPEDDGFRVGAEPPNFDFLTFTPIIEGVAQGIRFETGAEYSRFFTD